MDQMKHIWNSPQPLNSATISGKKNGLEKPCPESQDKTSVPQDLVDLKSWGGNTEKISYRGEAGLIKPAEKDLIPNAPPRQVTVLYYMNGQYDDIGQTLASSMMGLELVGSDENVNLVAQLGRNPYKKDPEDIKSGEYHIPVDGDWSGVRRYEIRQDSHDQLKIPNSEYIKLLDVMPDNPLCNYVVGDLYWSSGNQELATKYFDRAKELGIIEYMDDMRSEKSLSIRKEFNEKTRHLDEDMYDKKVYKSQVLEHLSPGTSMGDVSTLEDFIKWGVSKYPADHYVLVVMAHGGGWMGASEMSPHRMADAIEQGVDGANRYTGRNDKLDAIVFNSCYMGNLESVVEMKDTADVLLVSENYATSATFHDWPNIIGALQKNLKDGEKFDSRKFASDIVEYYRKEGKELKENFPEFAPFKQSYLTLTAVDTGKLNSLVSTWKEFTDACKMNDVGDNELFSCIKDAKHYASGAYNPSNIFGFYDQIRDVGSIMDNVINSDEMPDPVREAATNVLDAMMDVVINEQHEGQLMEGSTGLTVWGPSNAVDVLLMSDGYVDNVPEFARKSGWGQMLAEAVKSKPKPLVMGFMLALRSIRECQAMLRDPSVNEMDRKIVEANLMHHEKVAIQLKEDLDLTRDSHVAFGKVLGLGDLQSEAFSMKANLKDFNEDADPLRRVVKKSRMEQQTPAQSNEQQMYRK